MQFIINVLPNHHFSKADLKQFLLNIREQPGNIKLVIKRNSLWPSALIRYVRTHYQNSLVVNNYQEADRRYHSAYWINLHVTDCLLPNAVIQWEQIIKRHPGKVIQIHYLLNSQSLIQQTSHLIRDIQREHPVWVSTVKRMMKLPVNQPLFQLSLSQQLWMMLGLQNYRIIDTPKRYHVMNDFYFGSNVLYQGSPQLLKDYQQNGLSALVRMILNEPELVQIDLPTVILTELNFDERLRWLKQMIAANPLIRDAQLAKRYQKLLQRSVTNVKRMIFNSNLSRFQKSRRLAMVDRLG